jgi:hypothetical protein
MISLHPLKRFASMRRPFAPPSISSGNAKSRRDLKLSKINQERSIISYSALIVNWKISKRQISLWKRCPMMCRSSGDAKKPVNFKTYSARIQKKYLEFFKIIPRTTVSILELKIFKEQRVKW